MALGTVREIYDYPDRSGLMKKHLKKFLWLTPILLFAFIGWEST